MKRTLAFATIFAAVWLVPIALAETGNELFQKALVKERSEGNLKEAIKLYQQVVDKYGKDRALAAKALVAMAESQEKLGESEARKTYERIVRDYADQKEFATVARARLGGTGLFGARGDRAVWTGTKVDAEGTVSPDGRYLSFVDWDTGDLALHDLVSGTDRRLTNKGTWSDSSDFAEESAISPDGKQLAYTWYKGKDGHPELRLIDLILSDAPRRPKVLHDNQDLRWIAPYSWSPDGKSIAVLIQKKDRTNQVGVIDSSNGTLLVLKDVNQWTRPLFSPDGKYIAYDRPASNGDQQRDIFVVTVDGSREIPAVVHSANDVLIGWSPDGTRLLFSSDRTGSPGLWSVPFSGGKVQGSPELLKSDIGSSSSLGITASGTLYVYKRVNTRDFAIAPLDLAAGKITGPPVSFTEGYVESPGGAEWSRDGKYLAYPACNNGCIAIRSVATGQVRRLAHTLDFNQAGSWSPDDRSLLAHGRDLMGREGIFRIDVQSGEATAVILSEGLSVLAQWSPDGSKVYFSRKGVLTERDLSSGVEREVYREAGPIGILSPDGQYFAIRRADPATKTSAYLLVPVAGGEPRVVLRLMPPQEFGWGTGMWTPDSKSLIIDTNTGSHRELWLVAVTGGPPRKLDIDPDLWLKGSVNTGQQGFFPSPDGRSIAFQMGQNVSEVWALENFLPAAKASK